MRIIPLHPFLIIFFMVVSVNCFGEQAKNNIDKPILFKKIIVPDRLLAKGESDAFGGDIRIGDLNNNGEMDIVVYRSIDGVKPCFIGAFNQKGEYVKSGIYEVDPFQALDQAGVGKLVEMGIDLGRSVKKNLKIGICGEHGGEPTSIDFCHRAGMNYVSCSPFRVPIARLASAQAALRNK